MIQQWAFIDADATISTTGSNDDEIAVSGDNHWSQNETLVILIVVNICLLICVVLGIYGLRRYIKANKNAERSLQDAHKAELDEKKSEDLKQKSQEKLDIEQQPGAEGVIQPGAV